MVLVGSDYSFHHLRNQNDVIISIYEMIIPGATVNVLLIDGYRTGTVIKKDGRDILVGIDCGSGTFNVWVDISQCTVYYPKTEGGYNE